ncbi:ATP-binding protein [Psychrobacillus sp. FJAT-21963]|uniref:ATP-binding protein n=1 Tax=Psychrobacillus sp. FJAT-21963 TaxID=1712028 RepID=UPI0006FD3C71|nr:ATP-binding protein [Psychrobacillus sp. FJAT-21963]
MTFVVVEAKYKQRFEHVFQLYSGGLIFINQEGIILEVNSKVENILQTDRNELSGMNAFHILKMLKANLENKKEFIQELHHKGQAEFFCEIQTFRGELKYIRIRVSKQKDADLYLTEVNDESEKMKMKKRLDHTESLSTLGQLAASIAHEIRNPMTSLKGFTQLLYSTANDDGKRYLSVINDEINRMEEILTEFLEVSKPTTPIFTNFEIKNLILEVVNFMAPQALMQNINATINFEIDHTRKILGDRNLLKQVFINTIKNAIEAMSNGGNIYINISDMGDKPYVCVSIEDQGHGIEEKVLEKIFDPFYTTKTYGTGLGLAHINKVIGEHGGNIEVSSTVGKGTTFTFLLPLHNENKHILTI